MGSTPKQTWALLDISWLEHSWMSPASAPSLLWRWCELERCFTRITSIKGLVLPCLYCQLSDPWEAASTTLGPFHSTFVLPEQPWAGSWVGKPSCHWASCRSWSPTLWLLAPQIVPLGVLLLWLKKKKSLFWGRRSANEVSFKPRLSHTHNTSSKGWR